MKNQITAVICSIIMGISIIVSSYIISESNKYEILRDTDGVKSFKLNKKTGEVWFSSPGMYEENRPKDYFKHFQYYKLPN